MGLFGRKDKKVKESKTWKVRKGLAWVIGHTFLQASRAADVNVYLTDIEKVLKDTGLPYDILDPLKARVAYRYMVKGKIGKFLPKVYEECTLNDQDVFEGLKNNLEMLIQKYNRGEVDPKIEFRARSFTNYALAMLLAAGDKKAYKVWQEHHKKEKLLTAILLHEEIKAVDEIRYLAYDKNGKEKKPVYYGVRRLEDELRKRMLMPIPR